MYTKTKFFLISFCLVSFCSLCQNTFIPDDNFEQALIDLGWDSGPLDDFVPTANISGLISLDVSFDNTGIIISDLTGIEDFKALTQLFVQNNQLSSIDVGLNSNLQILWCFNNRLSNLDISQNPGLISLRCEDNQLTNLDASNNTNLNVLVCERNRITKIAISNSVGLSRFQCGYNAIKNLDLSKNTNIFYLSCEYNQITYLNLENNTRLSFLNCFNNQLCYLNLDNGNNSNFTSINFDENLDLNCVIVDNANGNHKTWVPTTFLNYVNIENECSNFIPIDFLENVFGPSYILPVLNHSNYFTETSGMGTPLNAGDVISTSQTIYIYNETPCYNKESNFVFVFNNDDYFVPKFFTPNSDGVNDVWQVYDRLNLVNNISIYNRHGKLIKFLPSTASSWDGTYNGELLGSDSYWYEIFLNSHEILRGYFALKR